MGRSHFLAILLLCAILSLSLRQGDGRRVKVLRDYQKWQSPRMEEKRGLLGREMVEMEMDYKDPGANIKTRGGMPFLPPPSPGGKG